MEEQRAMTSMRVFREFLKVVRDDNGREYVDASGVVSRECYDLWVSTRKNLPPNPEKAFQRSLSAHVTGVDGRVPFTSIEEEAVLKVLRRKERWPCFESSFTRFGLMGFRAKGFHEKCGEGAAKRRKISSNNNVDDDDSEDQDNSQQQQQSPPHAFNLLSLPPLNATSIVGTLTGSSSSSNSNNFNMAVAEENTYLNTSQMLLSEVGADAWGTILSLGRMLLVSKGWFQPKVLDAMKLLSFYERRFPGQGILVLDITAKKNNRVMFMNTVAQLALGVVEERWLPNSAQAFIGLRAVATAVKNPGQEVSVEMSIQCQDGTATQPMFCLFTAHTEEKVVIVRAFPKLS